MHNPFSYNEQPTHDMIGKMKVLRSEYKRLSDLLNEFAPKSRELALAQTNLEQSAMWAMKSISHEEQ